jgi:hypothetical protein
MPPINNQFVFFGAWSLTGLFPPAEAIAGAAAALGKGDPQFEQTELLSGFSVPQLSHLITLGCCEMGGACMILPAWRALPSLRSAPHCEQVSAVAGLRVPQNPQWMSAPACAALMASSSVTNFRSEGSSKRTFSGCGAPQFSQVFERP